MAVRHAERREDPLLHVRSEGEPADGLDDGAEHEIVRTRVLVRGARSSGERDLPQRTHMRGERAIVPGRARGRGGNAARVQQELPHRDRARGRRVGDLEPKQVALRWRVELDASLFDELHDRHRREGLAHGTDHERRVAGDRASVGDRAEAAEVHDRVAVDDGECRAGHSVGAQCPRHEQVDRGEARGIARLRAGDRRQAHGGGYAQHERSRSHVPLYDHADYYSLCVCEFRALARGETLPIPWPPSSFRRSLAARRVGAPVLPTPRHDAHASR